VGPGGAGGARALPRALRAHGARGGHAAARGRAARGGRGRAARGGPGAGGGGHGRAGRGLGQGPRRGRRPRGHAGEGGQDLRVQHDLQRERGRADGHRARLGRAGRAGPAR
ncbi:unnamed protein product, partial [Heterosigma akashiwo]